MESVWEEYEKAAVMQMMEYTFIGSPKTIQRDLQSFLNETEADEIMVASYIYDNTAKINSYKIVGDLFRNQNKIVRKKIKEKQQAQI